MERSLARRGAITNAAGVATSSVFMANATAGAYMVSASVSGVSPSAFFSLTNLAGILLPANVTVAPGQSATFQVALAAPASSPVFVTLSSSDPSKVTVTSGIIIPAGATVPATAPKVNGIAFGSAAITASASGLPPATQTVVTGYTMNFSPPSVSITGEVTQQLYVFLSDPAPAGGLTINVSSSNTGVATVPATVTFLANSTSVNVPVKGVAPGSATITAGGANVVSATAGVTVN